jgi:hypothetical protein
MKGYGWMLLAMAFAMFSAFMAIWSAVSGG